MVLLSYMMSPSYLWVPQEEGTAQSRKLRSRVDRAKHQESRLYKSIRQLPSLRETLQDVPIEATNKCRDTKVAEQDGCNMKYHTCLLGEQVALAN
eukprot:11284105-Ditylum_brightwellii.AAC.1